MPTPSDAAPAAARVLVLRAGGGEAAVAWEAAREVAERPAVARLPGSPPVVSGVVNVRGGFVPLVELGALLGRDASHPVTGAGWIVVVEHVGRSVAIGVDSLPELRDVETTSPAPDDATAPRPRGVRVEGRELPLIDAARLVADVLH
jgi:purine-binding chemotaxis protein CheW